MVAPLDPQHHFYSCRFRIALCAFMRMCSLHDFLRGSRNFYRLPPCLQVNVTTVSEYQIITNCNNWATAGVKQRPICCKNCKYFAMWRPPADSGNRVWSTVSQEFSTVAKERCDSFIPLTKVLKVFLSRPETWSRPRERSPNIGLSLSDLAPHVEMMTPLFASLFFSFFFFCPHPAIWENQSAKRVTASLVCLNKAELSSSIISRQPVNIHFLTGWQLCTLYTQVFVMNGCIPQTDEDK